MLANCFGFYGYFSEISIQKEDFETSVSNAVKMCAENEY